MIKKVRIACLLFVTLLVLYTLLRLGFYCIYFWHQSKGANLAGIFYWGMRLDFTALFYIDLPFWVYYFFLHYWLPVTIRTKVAVILLLVLNVPFLAINFIDLAYYRITDRRSNVDLLFVVQDSLSALPAFIKNYWYLFILFVIAIVGLTIAVKGILQKNKEKNGRTWYLDYLLGLITIGAFAFIARGTGARPIFPSTPLLYFEAEYQPLAGNSSLTFLYSMVKRQKQLELVNYYPEKQLDTIFTIRRQYPHEEAFHRKNVVIFILESFCREQLEPGSPYQAQTPFLDSLIRHSTWCNNAFANGVASNQGIVSILGSMPPLLDEPYFHSIYSNNKLRGIGSILKEQGYSTHFFMGAGPDHFGFGKFCKMAGIDQYHSRIDFNDDRYYDGNWGIFDHRFLPFGAKTLSKEKDPFLAVFFNLSSHLPFTIPVELRKQFNNTGKTAFLRSVSYVDYSLRLFFDSIKNSPVYKNTLFVFTADHSIIGYVKKSFDPFTIYRIPIFMFDPASPVYEAIDKPVQQTDIVPTILDKLTYSDPFMAFGRSIYDTTENYVVNKYQGMVQVTGSDFLLGYNAETNKPAYLLNTRNDSTLKVNLLDTARYADIKNRMLQFNKAVMQRYNNALIKNQLYIK
jgi:phosphoglycerol transferase MdoB-like AlkP superfamily enzyme